MRDLPGPGIEPVSPALAGLFSTTAPPEEPMLWDFKCTFGGWQLHSWDSSCPYMVSSDAGHHWMLDGWWTLDRKGEPMKQGQSLGSRTGHRPMVICPCVWEEWETKSIPCEEELCHPAIIMEGWGWEPDTGGGRTWRYLPVVSLGPTNKVNHWNSDPFPSYGHYMWALIRALFLDRIAQGACRPALPQLVWCLVSCTPIRLILLHQQPVPLILAYLHTRNANVLLAPSSSTYPQSLPNVQVSLEWKRQCLTFSQWNVISFFPPLFSDFLAKSVCAFLPENS